MREISFRAWNKNTKMMILPPSPCHSQIGPTMTFDGKTYINGKYQDLIYMPWTGLITKDADYIYEGDILGGQFEGGYILWCDTCKNLQYHACEECFACNGDVHWYEVVAEDGLLEVIGNIYENPDLL